jgi:hypothetical protein
VAPAPQGDGSEGGSDSQSPTRESGRGSSLCIRKNRRCPATLRIKPERPDNNVVALHRAEFVASIDKKLSEARRFFSLHDYASCAELVQQVLAADPQNSKAKALLELSSIKLSKRRLYKKIADPDTPRFAPRRQTLEPRCRLPRPATGPTDPQRDLENSRTNAEPAEPISSSVVIEPPPRPSSPHVYGVLARIISRTPCGKERFRHSLTC